MGGHAPQSMTGLIPIRKSCTAASDGSLLVIMNQGCKAIGAAFYFA